MNYKALLSLPALRLRAGRVTGKVKTSGDKPGPIHGADSYAVNNPGIPGCPQGLSKEYKMKSFQKILVAAAVLAPVQSFAASGDVPFNGTIVDTCVITVGSGGTITPNSAYTVLSSKEAGGTSGRAALLVTGNSYSVTAEAPTAWSTAPASASSATFASEYDLSGANTAANVTGSTATRLANGTTNVNVDLTATLPSGNYEAGNYRAVVVLRCE